MARKGMQKADQKISGEEAIELIITKPCPHIQRVIDVAGEELVDFNCDTELVCKRCGYAVIPFVNAYLASLG
jgi:hypothetical protein